MAEIRLAVRVGKDRRGLLLLLKDVFSDDDTNGNNGKSYNHFSKNKCDDKFLYDKYIDSNLSEEEILKEYSSWYMSTMNSYIERWQNFEVLRDSNGVITAIAYAYY